MVTIIQPVGLPIGIMTTAAVFATVTGSPRAALRDWLRLAAGEHRPGLLDVQQPRRRRAR